ncbi:uncharacterized protein LOC111299903 [Durio zibethinus]|uniref:RING-type E3 ubiquitin transferase n=1 Tax=Durio zibethinus TaxID=66656 RepID=A0A6P5ZF80_DURZI|nr:uncharacterized protein LOC111299903 [Durio zibethinus]
MDLQNIPMASVYFANIRQENDNGLDQLSEVEHDVFYVVFEYCYVSSLDPETILETFNSSFTCRRDIFLSEEFGPNTLLYMFASTIDPTDQFLQTVIVPDILFIAREIDNEPVNLGRKVIKLIVEVIVEVNTDDGVAQAIDDSLSTLNFKPASRSSIQALKRIKWGDDSHLPFKKRRLIEGLSSKEECSICTDEFLDGDEVASMPCGHVYHDGCIIRWLETSHLCPLCRRKNFSQIFNVLYLSFIACNISIVSICCLKSNNFCSLRDNWNFISDDEEAEFEHQQHAWAYADLAEDKKMFKKIGYDLILKVELHAIQMKLMFCKDKRSEDKSMIYRY